MKEIFFQVLLFEDEAEKAEKKRCLKSLQNQKYNKIEYLMVSEKESSWETIKEQLVGDYVLLMSMRDEMAQGFLRQIAEFILNKQDAGLVYTDEAFLSGKKKEEAECFYKPDWSKDTFLSFFYTGRAAVYKTEIAKKISKWDMTSNACRYYEFAMRFIESCIPQQIYHIPEVLYYSRKAAVTNEKVQELLEMKQSVFAKINPELTFEMEERTKQVRIVYPAKGYVSIVIPSKDNVVMLLKGIDSLKAITQYKDYDIVVVDNGSSIENKTDLEKELADRGVKYVYRPMEFNFSKMCNIGAAESDGEYILFLNDDMECIRPNWLERMLGAATQSEIGAVGAKLLYPQDKLIQHVGVVNIGTKMGPAHVLNKKTDEGVLAYGRNCLDYNYDAVTAACLLVKREHFVQVGGFDENFPIAYNDVDFCYKLKEAGYRNLVRTDAVLYHHESVSRGLDHQSEEKALRLKNEREALYEKHPWILDKGDGSYNPNYTLEDTDFSVVNADGSKEQNKKIRPKRYRNSEFYLTIECAGNLGEVSGWYYFIDDVCTNNAKAFVVLKDVTTGKQVWYESHKKCRKDVAQALGNEATMCGFACNIPAEELVKYKGYRIGICIQQKHFIKRNYLSMTENILD